MVLRFPATPSKNADDGARLASKDVGALIETQVTGRSVLEDVEKRDGETGKERML